MNVDLDAIAQRGRCEVSSLRLALPLVEQGYTPPFLARYRRDELGGLDEQSLWALSQAVRSQQRLDHYRDELHSAWQATKLQDPAIGRAVSGAKSRRLLDRLGRRIKAESNESTSLLNRIAVRVLNPEKGDGDDLDAIIDSMSPTVDLQSSDSPSADQTSPEVSAEVAVTTDAATSVDTQASSLSSASLDLAKLDDVLAKRLAGDPRIIGAAVRWLSKHAKIHVIEVSDPHGGNDSDDSNADESEARSPKSSQPKAVQPEAKEEPVAAEPVAAEPVAATVELTAEPVAAETSEPDTAEQSKPETTDPVAVDPVAVDPVASESTANADATAVSTETGEQPVAVEAVAASEATSQEATSSDATSLAATDGESPVSVAKKEKKAPKAAKAKAPKKSKKISPRQRRRRWLVSTLKPLAGKRLPAAKLSSFQIVMLGRALRSQVAQCAFDYDAAKLVAELQRAASGLNRGFGDRLGEVLLTNEASIRDAAEGAWWDEIQEQASARLVSIAAENLHRQINRGGVDAKVVMSIDAIGPRTAATAIVSADGRLLHSEDIPCQLSAAMRSLAVTKMGELIHQHHVDLIVISNGPARRACMIAVGELIKQSGDQTVRWTLADRSGADAYAGSPAGDQEMKQTPRRFRSAAWIAFSTLQPSQAMVKVDPLKLRLGSFQRELSDQAILAALEDVLVSGASRGGVDVNSTTAAWMERLPGMNDQIAQSLDQARRQSLITSRDELLARGDWPSEAHSRQALPFLRVFQSEEPLDGTLIHPDDYPLAKRLAKALEIELPPASPPGYELPDYHAVIAVPVEPTPPVEQPEDAEPAPFGDTALAEPESVEISQASQSDLAASPVAEAAPVETSASVTSDAPEATDTPEPTDPAPSAESSAESSDSVESTSTDSPAQSPSVDATSDESDAAAGVPAPVDSPSVTDTTVRRVKPEKAKVDKLIKEWQVGVRRSYQIVNWLCEPFGEGSVDAEAPAVMTSMPVLGELKQGDPVVGVVVGVMPFGVFVELTPECSGLIHVSRISDGYVEDLHEVVQVGDVVTAWVTGIDGKRRRVGLSAISPDREAELDAIRRDSRGHGADGGASRGGNRGRGSDQRGARGDASGGTATEAGQGQGQRGQRSGGDGQRGQSGQGQSRPGQSGGGQSGGGQGGGGQGGRGQTAGGSRAGGSRDGGNRGGGRDAGRGGRDSRGGQRGAASRGPRRPEVYEVVGKQPDSPTLTDAMQEGKEPLRSFGDLMQLFTKDKTPDEKPAQKQKQESKPQPALESPPVAENSAPAVEPAPSPTASSTPAVEAAETKTSGSTDSPVHTSPDVPSGESS